MDLVLEDMCNIVGAGHSLLPHKRGFLRNVFDEEVGSLGECTNEGEDFVFRAEECFTIVELSSAPAFSPGTFAVIAAVTLARMIYTS